MLLLLTSNLSAHDSGGFYVIPVPTDEIVEREVCNGTPVGNVKFTIESSPVYSVYAGQVYSTTTGHLVEITGGQVFNRNSNIDYRVTPSNLPPPTLGVKGPYYVIIEGTVGYARLL